LDRRETVGEEIGAIPCCHAGRGLGQRRSLVGEEEAGGGEGKLTEEGAHPDLVEEDAGRRTGLLISVFPLFFLLL
jgi:hypothetical protein